MLSSIDKMRKRHKKEVEKLQRFCQHKEWTTWKPYYWSPGHYAYDVKVCLECGKIMESNQPVQMRI